MLATHPEYGRRNIHLLHSFFGYVDVAMLRLYTKQHNDNFGLNTEWE